jgi:hypothetical protein
MDRLGFPKEVPPTGANSRIDDVASQIAIVFVNRQHYLIPLLATKDLPYLIAKIVNCKPTHTFFVIRPKSSSIHNIASKNGKNVTVPTCNQIARFCSKLDRLFNLMRHPNNEVFGKPILPFWMTGWFKVSAAYNVCNHSGSGWWLLRQKQPVAPHPRESLATSFSRAFMRYMHMEKMSLPIAPTMPQRLRNPASAQPIGMEKVVSARYFIF